ncbi:hypothetical protein MBLNU459_g2403t1 [Dothideomycetes sp. NU459]
MARRELLSSTSANSGSGSGSDGKDVLSVSSSSSAAPTRKLLATGKWSFLAMYFLLEMLTILTNTTWGAAMQTEAQKCWFYAIVASILLSIYDLFVLTATASPARNSNSSSSSRSNSSSNNASAEKTAQKNAMANFGTTSTTSSLPVPSPNNSKPNPKSDMSTSTSTTSTAPAQPPAQKQRPAGSNRDAPPRTTTGTTSKTTLYKQLAIDACDLLIPGTAVGWMAADSVTVGAAMAISSVVAGGDLWARVQNQRRLAGGSGSA